MTAIFIIYLLAVIGIAIYSAQRSKTNQDYVLGGKKISGVSLALSERATGESAWLLLGMTGHAYVDGIGAIWIALGCVSGIMFIWFFMSERLRDMTSKTGALTVSSLLSKKFPGSEKSIGFLSALIVVFFFFFYIAAQFSGAGKILHDTFGIEPFWGMIIGSVIVTIYTMFGGFITVVATDAFQAILMVITLIILPIFGLYIAASYDISLAQALANAGEVKSSLTMGNEGTSAVLFILSGLSWGFGYTGQPQLLTRMMAMRDRRNVYYGKWVAAIWTSLAYSGAFIIGLAGLWLVQGGHLGGHEQELAKDAEKIMPVMVMSLLNPLLAGILLSGAISAMMSTASSQLMVNSSSISEDIYSILTKKKLSERKLLIFNKILTLAVGVVAFAIALSMEETVYGLVSYAWSGIGSSFGPALVLLLFWKKLSRAGVFASLITGTTVTIFWKTLYAEPTGLSERLISYVLAFFMAWLFSLILPEKTSKK